MRDFEEAWRNACEHLARTRFVGCGGRAYWICDACEIVVEKAEPEPAPQPGEFGDRLRILIGRRPHERFRVFHGARDVSDLFDVKRLEVVLDAYDDSTHKDLRVRMDLIADVELEDVAGIDVRVLGREET